MILLAYPYYLLRFWYVEAFWGALTFCVSLNIYIAHLLSLPLFIRTFFKPLKNEYRKGLVRFSLGMGIFVKAVLIFTDLLILLVFLAIELVFLMLFVAFPFLWVYLSFFNRWGF